MKSFKVFTIKESIPREIFGFERTQLARQNLLESLNIEHEILINSIFTFLPNFVETLESLGFKNFYHVILDKSEISRDKPSIKPSDIEKKENIKLIKYTKNGYVGLVEYNNGIIECYTSSKLYSFNIRTEYFYLYNKNGDVILEGDLSDNYHYYKGIDSTKIKTQWEILIEYLAQNSNVNDKFFIDMVNKYPIQLRKFFQNTDRELISFTHYNILDPIMKFRLQKWCRNVVASPVLENLLKDEVEFLPPIYVNEIKNKEYKNITNWCIVGNMSNIKRCNWAIEAFRRIPYINLTIYGILPNKYKVSDLPDNVKYAGFLKDIPYNKHEGYLSCSMSECFANSAVEASSEGLVCLLSNTDLAHKYYKSICENTETFNTFEDLLEKLKNYTKIGLYKSSKFSNNYSKNKVLDLYSNFLDK